MKTTNSWPGRWRAKSKASWLGTHFEQVRNLPPLSANLEPYRHKAPIHAFRDTTKRHIASEPAS